MMISKFSKLKKLPSLKSNLSNLPTLTAPKFAALPSLRISSRNYTTSTENEKKNHSF